VRLHSTDAACTPQFRSDSTWGKVAAFDVETFGGPDRFTREIGGFKHLIAVHRGLRITEPGRGQRSIA